MKAKKQIDVFNFFYSIGAVVILIGVIAKFLEWKSQDAFLITGLSVEALVFTMSSIQYKKQQTKYRWEKLFPELLENPDQPSSIAGMHKNLEDLSAKYFKGMSAYVDQFENLNTGIVKGSAQYQTSLEVMSDHLKDSSQAFKDFKENVGKVSASFVELHAISEDIRQLQMNLQKMAAISIISGDKLNQFQEQLDGLNSAVYRFNSLSSGIINQFKSIGE